MDVEGWRILITGGAGFIGSHLIERLAGNNELVLLDTLHRNALAKTGLDRLPGVELIQGDVLDRAAVDAAIEGCNAVIHLASIAGVDTVMRIPVQTMRVALLGTANLLEAALAQPDMRRFVDFSTSEVFGSHAFNVSEGDVTSLGAVGEARWTYSVAKLATEHLCMCYYREHGLPAVAVRPFNIYGPRQVGEGAVHHFIVRALRGENLIIHNDGSQIRAWCYVDDIVNGVALCLSEEAALGNTFNIGNPRSTVTIYNLAREILRLCSSGSAIEQVTWDHADVELRIPNVDKARQMLGFAPQVDLEEGLLRTISWYRKTLRG